MIITEVKQDLFTVPQGYYLAHCISGDFALGAGIAKRFNEVYDMRRKLIIQYGDPEDDEGGYDEYVGRALLVDNVFNLVTKERYFNKPTYENFACAIGDLKSELINRGIKKLAIPHLGCGLDKLDWDIVKTYIILTFQMTDIEILICDY